MNPIKYTPTIWENPNNFLKPEYWYYPPRFRITSGTKPPGSFNRIPSPVFSLIMQFAAQVSVNPPNLGCERKKNYSLFAVSKYFEAMRPYIFSLYCPRIITKINQLFLKDTPRDSFLLGPSRCASALESLKTERYRITKLELCFEGYTANQVPKIPQRLTAVFNFFHNITSLHIHIINMNCDILTAIGSLKNLKDLSILDLCTINSDFFISLFSIPTLSNVLQKLNIRCTKIDENGLALICSKFGELKTLHLTHYHEQLQNHFHYISNLKNLFELNLSSSSINGKGLKAIAQSLNTLNILDLSFCYKIKGRYFCYLANLKNLVNLNVNYSSINTAGLKAIATSLKQLKILSLVYCSEVKRKDFHFLANLENLEELNLASTNIDGDGLKATSLALKKLKKFTLSSCTNIPHDDYRYITCFTELTNLNLRECDIDKKMYDEIKHSLKKLERFDVSKNIL